MEGLQKLDRIYNSRCDLWVLLMQYPGGQVPRCGQVPMSKPKYRLSILCQPPRENLGWHLQPQPWPRDVVTSPKQPIVTAREPDACSLLQREGRALFYVFPQIPIQLCSQTKKKNYSLQKKPRQGLLGTISRTSFRRNLIKNPGSNPGRLVPSCLPSDLDMIKLMET